MLVSDNRHASVPSYRGMIVDPTVKMSQRTAREVNEIARELRKTNHWDLHLKTVTPSDNKDEFSCAFVNKQNPGLVFNHAVTPLFQKGKDVLVSTFIKRGDSYKGVETVLSFKTPERARAFLDAQANNEQKLNTNRGKVNIIDTLRQRVDEIRFLDESYSHMNRPVNKFVRKVLDFLTPKTDGK